MRKFLTQGVIALLLGTATSIPALGQALTVEAVDRAEWKGSSSTTVWIKLQVLLDRAHASPGTIDGKPGSNSRKATAAFREMKGLPAKERRDIDEELWQALTEEDTDPILVNYTITDKDIDGPYKAQMPDDFREMAKLDHLSFTSVEEMLAERFHMAEELLRKLNPEAAFDRAGTEIVVANITRRKIEGRFARLEVKQGQVRAFDKEDRLVAVYPATIGSEERPSPTGDFKVTAIAEDPVYYYDPALNLSNVDAKEKLELPPGPNNPVGAVWVSLSAEGYGIHGTPHPEQVGKTASHGCIRLTNWDALELAKHVNKATAVTIADIAGSEPQRR